MLQNLDMASVPAALVTAVKAVWSSCPASTQARTTADLQRLLDHVQQRHGSAVDGARVRRTLEAVDTAITDAASQGNTDAFLVGGRPRDAAGHAQVSRQAKHYAHRGINALMSCDKAFQNPCHSAKREQKYVQQHIRICTDGVKTGLG